MAQVKANYNLDFISVGCNRVTNGVDWGVNNLIVYAAHKFVAILDPDDGKIIATLPGHKNRVNCVKWLPNVETDYATRWQQKETEIASASADRNIVIWKYRPESGKYQASAVLTGHEDAVNSLSVLDLEDGSLLLASCSGDRTVRIWKRTAPNAGNAWSLMQTIQFSKMMETVALALLPGSQIPVLAIAGVEHVIHLYAQPEATFAKVTALTGHEDWIRAMSFVHRDDNTLLLATAAQDRRIRMWAFTAEKNVDATQEDATSALLSKLALADNAHFDISDISQRGLIAKITPDRAYSIILDSVLVGHDDWVLGLSWAPPVLVEGRKHQPLQLLSASMDRSMIVWTHDEDEQLWTERARVGDIGGNHLGFFGAAYAKTGRYILASGYNGAFHLWKQRVDGDDEAWEPHVPVSGHFDEVRDISWDPKQQYLLSVSKDQTARLYGVWARPDDYAALNPSRTLSTRSWNEVARPQVHGYDLNCLAFVGNHSHRFASGAEEKVIRIFDAPKSFVTSFNNITKISLEDKNEEDRPMTANVGPLGLTNKPVFEKKVVEKTEEEKLLEQLTIGGGGGEDDEGGALIDGDQEGSVNDRAPLILTVPPVEEQLLQRTLWAECQKLYGHGNELLTLATNTSGDLMASACKGTTVDQSAIRVWDTVTWREKAVLKAHSLSAIQLAFSHNDKYLLGVSRDRTYSVFSTKKNDQGAYEFKLLKKFKAHARILWSCDWSPDDRFFVTGSRDKTAKLWRTTVNAQNDPDWTLDSTLSEFKSAVTAVAFAPVSKTTHATLPFDYLLAAGLENGAISLWTATEMKEGDKSSLKWSNLLTVDTSHAHVESVKRLRWRAVPGSAEQLVFDLASCSTDHSIRIFHISVALK